VNVVDEIFGHFEPLGVLPFVSVVMPVRNESKAIVSCIRAVLNQDYPADLYEVIVADGMSTDNTRELILDSSRGRNVRIVDNPRHIAPTALNVAIRESCGDVIVRVDGHCIVKSDYLRNCVDLLREHNCSGVGGPIITIGTTPVASAIAAAMSSRFGVGGSAFRTVQDREMWVDTIPFPAYRRALFEEVGLYDEELVRNQDDEFNARVRKSGGKLLLSPALKSEYFSRSSLRSLWRQYYQYGAWKIRVLQKHPGQMSLRHFLPSLFVSMLLASAIGTIFSTSAAWCLATLLFTYVVANLIATMTVARRSIRIHYWTLPFAFMALHFGYGVGALVGLARFRGRWGDHIGGVPEPLIARGEVVTSKSGNEESP
jgi:succinoglycan biosynthesis protein ExoA